MVVGLEPVPATMSRCHCNYHAPTTVTATHYCTYVCLLLLYLLVIIKMLFYSDNIIYSSLHSYTAAVGVVLDKLVGLVNS